MLTRDVVDHFGTKVAVAKALGIKRGAVSRWDDLVPPLRAAQIEQLTNGKLKFDLEAYRHWYSKRAQ